MQHESLIPEFVEFIPEKLEEGLLYVSLKYGCVIHLCACGCGLKTVTPVGKDCWRFFYDGTVTLEPSIGNFQFPCRSHYFIRNNQIVWA